MFTIRLNRQFYIRTISYKFITTYRQFPDVSHVRAYITLSSRSKSQNNRQSWQRLQQPGDWPEYDLDGGTIRARDQLQHVLLKVRQKLGRVA